MTEEQLENLLDFLYEEMKRWEDKADRYKAMFGDWRYSDRPLGVSEGLLRAASFIQAAKQGLNYRD